MHVDFFPSRFFILVVPYKLLVLIVLLHDHSNDFFLMVITLPKLHCNGLFCRALASSKMTLVFVLMVKSIFFEPKSVKINIWKNNFFKKQTSNSKNTLSLRRQEKAVKPLFLSPALYCKPLWSFSRVIAEAILLLLI
jgi:hypothetical protein